VVRSISLHATDDDLLMPIANKLIAAPSDWLALLGEVAVAVAQSKQIDAPAELAHLQPSPTAKQIAAGLLSGEPRAIVLGNAAAQHPQASQLHALAQWIATHSNAQFGYLTEAANTVGGYLAKALPANRNLAVAQFTQAKKAYVLLNVEPELDCANPQLARSVDQAEMVVVMSPYRHGWTMPMCCCRLHRSLKHPVPFVNAEGRAQGFNGTVKPLGETRPAWKVLRVLGNLLSLEGFSYESSEDIRNEVLGVKTLDGWIFLQRLNNQCRHFACMRHRHRRDSTRLPMCLFILVMRLRVAQNHYSRQWMRKHPKLNCLPAGSKTRCEPG
jgi:NADH-quinone oxidoreductase subunit G